MSEPKESTPLVEKAKKVSAHVPKLIDEKVSSPMRIIKAVFFELLILFCRIILYIFFREVRERNSFNVPKKGATIVVVAPHANQFVDGAIILSKIKSLTNRNTRAIIAESSYNDKIIGGFARVADSIPVARAQDNLKPAQGEVYCKGDDYKTLHGRGTKFTEFMVKGLIGLPSGGGNIDIEEIVSDTELVLRKPVKSEKCKKLLQTGLTYKYAGKISNDDAFQHVFSALHNNGLITIFPEGGSHDRPDLLPIKAGFAIMALGAVAADPSCTVQIVPTGLNYFHRNKFRSRAVVEFGAPIKVTAEDGERYKENPRETVAKLLDEVTTALRSVIVTAPDFETLQVIQATRRLYTKKVPLSLVVEINRKLVIGYTRYKDDPRIIHLKKAVLDYNRDLYRLGLRDHQVELAFRNRFQSFGVLSIRLIKIIILFSMAVPGTLLFAPIFILTHYYSKKKQKAALAKSVVKIKAVDIIATWKILTATIFAPSLYVTYSLTGIYLTKKYNILNGSMYHPIPLFIAIYLVLVLTTYSAFITGESGVDIVKSLPPLFNSVFGNRKRLTELRERREKLSLEITEVVNSLGPSVFPEFDQIARDYLRHGGKASKEFKEHVQRKEAEEEQKQQQQQQQVKVEESEDDNGLFSARSRSASSVSTISNGLSRVNSDGNLSDVPILGEGGYGYYSSGNEDDSGLEFEAVDKGREKSEALASLKLRKALRERIDQQEHEEYEDE